MAKRTQEDYYKESKRIRAEVLQEAEFLKGNPMRFTISNGITMEVEITKSDLRTLVGKSTRSNKFNAIKNALEWLTVACISLTPSYLSKCLMQR
jgi:hypothetical protein